MSPSEKKTTPEASANKAYTATSIRVMEGLEAVRKRPGMYIGTTGPAGLHHLVYEVVDNAVDEALGGHCDTIRVTLHDDGSCSVLDNGRGIPTEIHPEEKVSALQVVLTKLHAGGKFDKESYKFSGGLHGVGVSVVNALSSTLEVTVFRNGTTYHQVYHRGKPEAPVAEIGKTDKHGTIVKFSPDPAIFTETVEFNYDRLAARFRELAFLNKGLHITLDDERQNREETFYFEGGIVSFVEHISKKKTPLFPEVLYSKEETEQHILECAVQYNEGYDEQIFSFVNTINTPEGGTHVAGFRAALTKACNKHAVAMGFLKGEDAFSSEDVREGLVCVLSIKIPEPQFEGQTKAKLGNSEIKGVVSSWIFSFLDTYFEENPAVARKIFQKALMTMRAREAARKARDLTRRKSVLESTVLPGKLADCSLEEPEKCELFIVEGDSAGGSAKGARDRFTQAILPLRGKILNVEKARFDRALSNEEIRALISAVGCGADREETDVSNIRYHKIILMTDADVDGSHIRTLLLTFFFRYMRPVVEHGYLYVAQPPLYRIKIGKTQQYLKDEREFTHFLLSWAGNQTECEIEGKSLTQARWGEALGLIEGYEQQVELVSRILHCSPAEVDTIAAALVQSSWLETKDHAAFSTALGQMLTDCELALENQQVNEEGEDETTLAITRQYHTWRLPLRLLGHHDVQKLLALRKPLEVYAEPWTIRIKNSDKVAKGRHILDVLHALKQLSKPQMNIQRYKGLGEMNPEQLWETAMDPAQRSLLRVTLDDTIKADLWFSTLMGDDIAGRRSFIEERGHFAKNIDA
ncbi:MAG: DNA topoisomerase (ATP-hydrolyzing) subunit B [Candidatus Dependentiae bacterium]|nr:DNA topoisomerase (ATP-hydrolyzing) subunit B [Candidatus Dependentiae bacterium]